MLEMNSGVRWERLVNNDVVDMLRVIYQPGGMSSTDGTSMNHTAMEYAHILEGELTIKLGFEEYTLAAGDSIAFDAMSPHMFVNRGKEPAVGIWFVANRDQRDTSAVISGQLSSAVGVLQRFRQPQL